MNIKFRGVILLLGIVLSPSLVIAQTELEKVVLVEMFTGHYCYSCLPSMEKLKDLDIDYPNQVVSAYYGEIAVSGKGNEFAASLTSEAWCDQFANEFGIAFFSGVMVDRANRPAEGLTYESYENQEGDPIGGPEYVVSEDLYSAIDAQLTTDYIPVGLTVDHIYDASTRAVDITVNTNFVDTASGDFGIFLILTQNRVSVEGFHQIVFPDIEFAYQRGYSEEDIISDGFDDLVKNYNYPFVVKYIASGFYGNSGVISESVEAGDSFSETFSFMLPEYTYDEGADNYGNTFSPAPFLEPSEMNIVVAVVRQGAAGEREILNAGTIGLTDETTSVGIIDNDLKESFKILENPVLNNQLKLEFNEVIPSSGVLSVYNTNGKVLFQNKINSVSNQILTLDLEGFSSGLYLCNYHSGNINYARNFVVK
tara:strand:+ start:381 stop:1649 length:1269 start_codon:yes stop_codon:yes gene_type:complete